MANIITSLGGDLAASVTNGRIARPLPSSWVGNWNTLRVALYLNVGNASAGLSGGPILFVGLCKGSAIIPGDNGSVIHALGASPITPTWSIGIDKWGLSTSNWRAFRAINSGLSIAASLFTGANYFARDVAGSPKALFFLDFVKGSPNYSLNVMNYSVAATTPAETEASFLSQSLLGGYPIITNYTWGGATTMATDEVTNGYFDHVCVWWNQQIVPVNIFGLRVIKFS